MTDTLAPTLRNSFTPAHDGENPVNIRQETIRDVLLFDIPDSERITNTTHNTGVDQTCFTLRAPEFETSWIYVSQEKLFAFRGWSCPDKKEQNKGLTKKLFANRLALAHVLGVRKMTSIFTNVGAYAFARIGFIPTEHAHPSYSEIKNTLDELEESTGKIQNERMLYIEKILEKNSQMTIWEIADLRDIIDNRPIGFHLLNKNMWQGVFDLGNLDQMARARTYIGPDHFDAVMDMADTLTRCTPLAQRPEICIPTAP